MSGDIMKSPLSLWDRRDVMIAGGAAAGAIAITGALAATSDKNCLIVADTRIATSREFAAASNDERIAWIEGDVTKLWYEELDTRWRDEKIAVAGLTEYGPFFCLERLAMDRGLRLAFKGSHRRVGSQLLHDIRGPKETVTEQALNTFSDQHWPAHASRMAMASRVVGQTTSKHYAHSSAVSERWPLLVSWLIVPKCTDGNRA